MSALSGLNILANMATRNDGFQMLKTSTSEIRQVLLNEKGILQCIPAEVLYSFDFNEFRIFAHEEGIYQFPTTELITFLKELIGSDSCIEIGAGTGSIGRSLGIKTTDSYLQKRAEVKAIYEANQQPIIKYPADVEKLSYKDAIKKYKPRVALGCWITRQYNRLEHDLGGSMFGLDYEWIVKSTKRFILVGNTNIHPLNTFPKGAKVEMYFPEGNVSRAKEGQNFVAVFKK